MSELALNDNLDVNNHTKGKRGRPPKDAEKKVSAITLYLHIKEIDKLNQLCAKWHLNKSQTIARFLNSLNQDDLDQDLTLSATCRGRVHGARKMHEQLEERKKGPTPTKSPLYILVGLEQRPKWVSSRAMQKVKIEGLGLYNDWWVVSEKALCYLGCLIEKSQIYSSIEDAHERLDLNHTMLAKKLAQRIESNDLNVSDEDVTALEALKHKLQEVIMQTFKAGELF